MANEIVQANKNEFKFLANGLKESLILIKNLALVVFSGFITFLGLFFKSLSRWREQISKILEKQAFTRKVEQKEKLFMEKRALEKRKITEERREEDRENRALERRLRISDHRSPFKFIYLLLASISSVALLVAVQRLSPIAQWTKNQNECIEYFASEKNTSDLDFVTQVMRCNGGHE